MVFGWLFLVVLCRYHSFSKISFFREHVFLFLWFFGKCKTDFVAIFGTGGFHSPLGRTAHSNIKELR